MNPHLFYKFGENACSVPYGFSKLSFEILNVVADSSFFSQNPSEHMLTFSNSQNSLVHVGSWKPLCFLESFTTLSPTRVNKHVRFNFLIHEDIVVPQGNVSKIFINMRLSNASQFGRTVENVLVGGELLQHPPIKSYNYGVNMSLVVHLEDPQGLKFVGGRYLTFQDCLKDVVIQLPSDRM